jgi:hypothetical protein
VAVSLSREAGSQLKVAVSHDMIRAAPWFHSAARVSLTNKKSGMKVTVKINRMNPAEYFASLGVLELLSQHDSDLLSHFSGEGNLVDFCVASGKDIALPDLRTLSVEALPFDDTYTGPVQCGELELNWWLDGYKEKSNGLKLWAGTTTPCMMLKNYQSLMQGECSLSFSVRTKTKSTFNLDTRASRDPLVAGYSQKDAGEASILYPYTEFLCAIGLQNFRPPLKPLRYFTWAQPVRVGIAHAACRQDIPGLHSQGFEVGFAKVSQGMREVKSVDPCSKA